VPALPRLTGEKGCPKWGRPGSLLGPRCPLGPPVAPTLGLERKTDAPTTRRGPQCSRSLAAGGFPRCSLPVAILAAGWRPLSRLPAPGPAGAGGAAHPRPPGVVPPGLTRRWRSSTATAAHGDPLLPRPGLRTPSDGRWHFRGRPGLRPGEAPSRRASTCFPTDNASTACLRKGASSRRWSGWAECLRPATAWPKLARTPTRTGGSRCHHRCRRRPLPTRRAAGCLPAPLAERGGINAYAGRAEPPRPAPPEGHAVGTGQRTAPRMGGPSRAQAGGHVPGARGGTSWPAATAGFRRPRGCYGGAHPRRDDGPVPVLGRPGGGATDLASRAGRWPDTLGYQGLLHRGKARLDGGILSWLPAGRRHRAPRASRCSPSPGQPVTLLYGSLPGLGRACCFAPLAMTPSARCPAAAGGNLGPLPASTPGDPPTGQFWAGPPRRPIDSWQQGPTGHEPSPGRSPSVRVAFPARSAAGSTTIEQPLGSGGPGRGPACCQVPRSPQASRSR